MINESRLRKVEARAPKDYGEIEFTRVIVEPGEAGGPPKTIGAFNRTRSIRGGCIIEEFAEPYPAADTLADEMIVTRRILRRDQVQTIELFDPPVPELLLPKDIDGEAVERYRRQSR